MEDDEEEYDNIPDWAQYGGFADRVQQARRTEVYNWLGVVKGDKPHLPGIRHCSRVYFCIPRDVFICSK